MQSNARKKKTELTVRCAGGRTGGQEAAGKALPVKPMSPRVWLLPLAAPTSRSTGQAAIPHSCCSSAHIPGWVPTEWQHPGG